MRTPEKCPWCGGKPTSDPKTFRCGWSLSPWDMLMLASCGQCQRKDTPAAAEYRRILAWRKRLSQHTGVRLVDVPEPSFFGEYAYWADIDVKVIPVGRRIRLWLSYREWNWSRLYKRAEARRRLMEWKEDK